MPFCRVSCHQGLINAVGSLTLPDCRQQLFNLPPAGVKAVQIPLRIAVAAHGNQIILSDKSLQSADITEDGRNHTPFQHSHRNPCCLLHTPLKAENPDHLAVIRVGDFYELFGKDAETAAEALGLTLTFRKSEKSASTPYSSFSGS